MPDGGQTARRVPRGDGQQQPEPARAGVGCGNEEDQAEVADWFDPVFHYNSSLPQTMTRRRCLIYPYLPPYAKGKPSLVS